MNKLIIILLILICLCGCRSYPAATEIIKNASHCESIDDNINSWIYIDINRLNVLKNDYLKKEFMSDTLFLIYYYDTDANGGSGYGFGCVLNSKKTTFYECTNGNTITKKDNWIFNKEILNMISKWDKEKLIALGSKEYEKNKLIKKSFPIYVTREIFHKDKVLTDCFSFYEF